MRLRILATVTVGILSIVARTLPGAAFAEEQKSISGYDHPPVPVNGGASPNGRYAAFEGKAKDGYHDTIWLRDSKTGATVDLLAPGDAKWPGAGATQIVVWLDKDRILFTWHCGTGCTSLELINVETRSHRYFCTDGTFQMSPDNQYAVGENGNPYGPDDKRAGLAVISVAKDDSYPGRQGDCEATVRGFGQCRPDQPQETRSVAFGQWSSDGKSFTYTITPCIGGRWRHEEKRVFHIDSAKPAKTRP